jgi:hypothetical protein
MPYTDKKKQLEYQRKWMAERRKSFFINKKCEKCDSTINLELHHVDPNEKENHRIWSWSEERRLKELEKCVVWCRDCHEKYHSKLKEKPITHGTARGYKKGCRCVLCKKWRSDAGKNYRKRKKLGLI